MRAVWITFWLCVLGAVGQLVTGNLAKGKPTKQSSYSSGGDSSRAVDGNKDTNWIGSSCTRTNKQRGAWWRVDLGGSYQVGKVKLTNRGDCCWDRLTNFDIRVGNISYNPDHNTLDNPDCLNTRISTIVIPSELHNMLLRRSISGQEESVWMESAFCVQSGENGYKVRCYSHFGAIGRAQTKEIKCREATPGRFLFVKLHGIDYLTLCEVEVLAAESYSKRVKRSNRRKRCNKLHRKRRGKKRRKDRNRCRPRHRRRGGRPKSSGRSRNHRNWPVAISFGIAGGLILLVAIICLLKKKKCNRATSSRPTEFRNSSQPITDANATDNLSNSTQNVTLNTTQNASNNSEITMPPVVYYTDAEYNDEPPSYQDALNRPIFVFNSIFPPSSLPPVDLPDVQLPTFEEAVADLNSKKDNSCNKENEIQPFGPSPPSYETVMSNAGATNLGESNQPITTIYVESVYASEDEKSTKLEPEV